MNATRVGDFNSGHDGCVPTSLISGSDNVFINERSAGRVSDIYSSHGCEDHSIHQDSILAGSESVIINGKSAARIGDPVSYGSKVSTGSNNVLIGG